MSLALKDWAILFPNGELWPLLGIQKIIHNFQYLLDDNQTYRWNLFRIKAVLFCRSYSKCAEPKPWEDDKIKAYALCPWFADTQLFNDSKGVNETEKKSRENLSNRFRVLTVEDVGDALEQALDADDNGNGHQRR